MKYSIIILLLITILSCSRENENDIPLFNGITFKIHEGEAIGIVNSTIINIYTENFNKSKIQIPLFKYIKHSNYEIFIGIPYNTSIKALAQNQLENQDSLMTNLKSDSHCYYKKYKKNNSYIVEYAEKVASNSLIFLSTMSFSKELTDSLFIKSELSSRLNMGDK